MILACDKSELTDQGGREINEDAVASHENARAACWVVCDGLGGHHGGEVASRTAADAILAAFTERPECSEAALHEYLAAAEAAVIERQGRDVTLEMMRTTAVLLVSDYETAAWAHIGDSRLYHFRNGQIVTQTRDHSVPGVFAATGQISVDEIRHHVDRSRLLRSLGEGVELKPAIAPPLPVSDGDAFLLCTDGFWEYVLESEMEQDLAAAGSPDEWVASMRRRLLERIDGTHDNFTAVAVCFGNGARMRAAVAPAVAAGRQPPLEPPAAAPLPTINGVLPSGVGAAAPDVVGAGAPDLASPRRGSAARTAGLVVIVVVLVGCLAAAWVFRNRIYDLLNLVQGNDTTQRAEPGRGDGRLPATTAPAGAVPESTQPSQGSGGNPPAGPGDLQPLTPAPSALAPGPGPSTNAPRDGAAK